MSLKDRQKTCAYCGRPFETGDKIIIEPLIDSGIRYVAVHWDESTFTIQLGVENDQRVQPKREFQIGPSEEDSSD